MNRADLQKLTRTRIKEAKALLDLGYYDGAYYLAGYAVECALKACIAKKTHRYDFPDKKQAEESYTHDLTKLIKVAKLEDALKEAIAADSIFADHWIITRGWSEAARYEMITTESAKNLYHAIVDRKHGVLSWLKKFW